MKTKLLTIFLFLVTSQVFADNKNFTEVYNEETGWVPSDNVWLYHFVRARPAIPQIFCAHENPDRKL